MGTQTWLHVKNQPYGIAKAYIFEGISNPVARMPHRRAILAADEEQLGPIACWYSIADRGLVHWSQAFPYSIALYRLPEERKIRGMRHSKFLEEFCQIG